MAVVNHPLSQLAPGVLGASTGALLSIKAIDLPIIVIAIVVTVSVGFGMAVPQKETEHRVTLFNAGAIWLAAFCAAVLFGSNIIWVALIAMGTGLAGPLALDMIRKGTVSLFQRALGALGPGASKGGDE